MSPNKRSVLMLGVLFGAFGGLAVALLAATVWAIGRSKSSTMAAVQMEVEMQPGD